MPDALDLPDQQVDRFGPAVRDAARVEVREELRSPRVDRAGQAVQLRDVRVGAVHQPAVQALFGVGPVAGALLDQAQVLGGDPRVADLPVDVVS